MRVPNRDLGGFAKGLEWVHAPHIRTPGATLVMAVG